MSLSYDMLSRILVAVNKLEGNPNESQLINKIKGEETMDEIETLLSNYKVKRGNLRPQKYSSDYFYSLRISKKENSENDKIC